MEDHILINVAKANGRKAFEGGPSYSHHFAARVRDPEPAKLVFAELLAAFPEPEYKVTATHWKTRGHAFEA